MLALGADVVTPLPSPYLRILIEGLRSEVVVNDKRAQQVFSLDQTPYQHALRAALQRDGSGEVEALWRGSPVGQGPGSMHKDVEGMYIAQRRTISKAEPDRVFAAFSKIGGKRGWYYANGLWWLRGRLDELVGGPGMRRGRRDPDELIEGDILDGWKVEKVEPGKLVRLSFDMKAPGPAWLQFEAQSRDGGGSLLVITAFFEPHGVAGLAYWWSLYIFHLLIFKGMSEAIVKMAEGKTSSI